MTGIDYSLYLVTDREMAGSRGLLHVVEQAIAGGVTLVQLREKNLPTRAFFDAAVNVKAMLDRLNVPLIINDRVDIAIAARAHGVHVGQDDMACRDAREAIGPEMILGVSVSTPEEAGAAEADGADYLGVSPVFDTPTKADAPAAVGLEGVAAIRAATKLPLVAIGSIGPGNAGEVIRAGADGVAVVSAIMAAADPEEAARAIRAAVDSAKGSA